MNQNDQPLTAREFEHLMAAVGLERPGPKVAVAVSGGADSMALTLLAAEWGDVTGLIFDHQLRDKSDEEAGQVAVWLEAADIQCEILKWSGDKPASDLQAAARAARYAALEGWCRENGAGHLLLGHHRDDQAETFLIRLARGSGVDGLSAMAGQSPPLTRPDGPLICRPLLAIPKSRLKATLKARDQEWIEDPTNQDPAYLRTQVRQLLRDSEIDGLSPERLSETADRMASVRRYLDEVTADYLRLTARFDPGGYVEVAKDFGSAVDPVIGLRALARVLRIVSGADYAPRQAKLERLYDDLCGPGFAGATLGGCQLVFEDRGPSPNLLVVREVAALEAAAQLAPGQTQFWDGRYLITYEKGPGPLTVQGLGEAGWRQVAAQWSEDDEIRFPRAAALSLPSFWKGQNLLAVPHLEMAGPQDLVITIETGGDRQRWDQIDAFT